MRSFLHSSAFNIFLGVSIVFIGCGLNSIFIEAIIKIDSNSGTLVALFQFLLVALIECFSSQIDYKTLTLRPMKLPIKFHAALTFLFFLASLANNLAYYYNISQPFHITFRSSSLAGSLLVGAFFFGKTYPLSQWVGVFLTTFGVLYVTLVNSDYIHLFSSSGSCCGATLNFTKGEAIITEQPPAQTMGLILLTFSIIAIAVLGHLQDKLKKIYGSDWRENIFYTHLISTFSVIFFYNDVHETLMLWNEKWLLYSFFTLSLPVMWSLTFMNGLTQYVCMCGVQMLAFYSDPVTLNLVVTLRKFISLVASIIFFKNVFGLDHFVGTTLVFIGTVIYYVGFGKNECQPQLKQVSVIGGRS